MRFAVIVFPGSNCDHEALYAVERVLGQPVRAVWHKETRLGDVDAVILPGGFSHGDYLRTGAIARFSPVMGAGAAVARPAGPVLGICNGFQILLEAGLLEGAMLRNDSLQFRCEHIHVRVDSAATPFTQLCHPAQVLKLPVSHGEGNYYAPPEMLARLEANGQVVFRYCDVQGHTTEAANPNGSLHHIAGICNERRNVVGLMPHPERACEPVLGSGDGLVLFESVLAGVPAGS